MTNRDTITLVDAEILSHDAYEGEQHILRIQAPEIAAKAEPGNFAHIRCGEPLLLRRPISIMRVDEEDGWVEFLYKVIGAGTRLLSQQPPGAYLSILAPIGTPFQLHADRPRTLLIGGGVGMPPMVFLADRLRRNSHFKPLVILGSEVPFPFRPWPSKFLINPATIYRTFRASRMLLNKAWLAGNGDSLGKSHNAGQEHS